MTSSAQTKTIHEFLADAPDVDRSELWASLWGILTEVKETITAELAVHPHPSGEGLGYWTSEDGRTRVLFIEVPDKKQVKNRVHFDLVPAEGTRDEEAARLVSIGAMVVDDLRRPDGSGWVVLADPEGNEFCILRSEAERAAARG